VEASEEALFACLCDGLDPRASEHKLGDFYGKAMPDKGVGELSVDLPSVLKGGANVGSP
jgi:hypothetical protein